MRRAAWLLLLVSLPGIGSAADWHLDAATSHLGFVATWEGTPFDVEVRRFDVDIQFDPADPAAGRLAVNVDISSLDAGGADQNQGLQLPEWFNGAKFPRATFTSDAIRALGGGRFIAAGTLAVKGVSRHIELPFRWTETGGQARLQGETTLDRSDFKLGEGEWASGDGIGLDVRVRFDMTLAPA